jgi:hypothetical protein
MTACGIPVRDQTRAAKRAREFAGALFCAISLDDRWVSGE